MSIFDRFSKPIFLKEDRDAKDCIEKPKRIKLRANGQLVQRLDKEIKIAGIGPIK